MIDIARTESWSPERDDWRRPVAERLRLIASQIESGNVSSVVCVSKCGDLWAQDIRYDDQYEAVGALEQTKLTLLMGRAA